MYPRASYSIKRALALYLYLCCRIWPLSIAALRRQHQRWVLLHAWATGICHVQGVERKSAAKDHRYDSNSNRLSVRAQSIHTDELAGVAGCRSMAGAQAEAVCCGGSQEDQQGIEGSCKEGNKVSCSKATTSQATENSDRPLGFGVAFDQLVIAPHHAAH